MLETISISEASSLTGFSEKQLRTMEDNGFISPARITCGAVSYRRYTEKDLKLLQAVREKLVEGYTLPAAFAKTKEVK